VVVRLDPVASFIESANDGIEASSGVASRLAVFSFPVVSLPESAKFAD
jgi:hypothetical protein